MWFDDYYGHQDQYDNHLDNQNLDAYEGWQMDTEQSGYDYQPISYVNYRNEMDSLLRHYAQVHDPKGPAHCNISEDASATSHYISQFVRVHWREEFVEQQYPLTQRKNFGAYNPDEALGN